MKNLKVTAMILAAVLSAGTLVGCSSDKETNNTVSTVESELVENESEESVPTESESTETVDGQEMDAVTEAVLEQIIVARVEKVAEDGTVELMLFELPNAADKETEANTSETETAGTEETTETETVDAEETTETETVDAEETTETADSEETETTEFDFTSLDLSIFVETEQTESYQFEENAMVQLVEDGVLTEAVLTDIQEGDMLVMFTDAEEAVHIIIYRNVNLEAVNAE